MLRTLMATSSCVGLLMAATAPAVAQQPYGSEQRAFEQVARAVESFGYSPTLAGAEEVLAAAESARNAFATAEAARDSRHERVHALAAERTPDCLNDSACRISNPHGSNCSAPPYRNSQDWLPGIFNDCLEHSVAPSWSRALRLNARHHDAVGEYLDLVGIDDASAQGLAENTRLYANAFGRITSSLRRILDDYWGSAHDLHGHAVNAHVRLHRTALEAVSRAARAVSQAANQLGDDYYGIGIQNVRRAAAELDRALSAARGAERNGDETDRALDSMVAAARQTVAALRTNLAASRRYEAEPDPGQQEPVVRPGRPAPSAEPTDSFDPDAWAADIRAAVAAAESAAGDAEAAARSSREPLWARNACVNAAARVANYSSRVSSLIYENRFIPSRGMAQAWSRVRERLENAMARASAACDSLR